MAWLKDFVDDSGVTIGYWEIEKITIFTLLGYAEISFQGWVSQDAKTALKTPVYSGSIKILQGEGPGLLAAAWPFLEGKVKELPMFDGATEI